MHIMKLTSGSVINVENIACENNKSNPVLARRNYWCTNWRICFQNHPEEVCITKPNIFKIGAYDSVWHLRGFKTKPYNQDEYVTCSILYGNKLL